MSEDLMSEDFEKVKALPDVEKENEPIASPIKRFSQFEMSTNKQMMMLDKKRDERKKKILEDIEEQDYLKKMDIIHDILSYIETTELVDSLFIQQKNTYVQIIEEMLGVVEEEYVSMDEFNELNEKTKNYEKKLLQTPETDKITLLLNKFKTRIEKEIAEGAKTQRLNGIRLNIFREINLDNSLTKDEKLTLSGLISSMVDEHAKKEKKDVEESGTNISDSEADTL